MKENVLKGAAPSSSGMDSFIRGLVFGFDVGTGSIGYAVRKGTEFKDVGVLICPEETNDLSSRRALRRQRRTLRSRKYRRRWFARQLTDLGLSKPTEQQLKRGDHETTEQFELRTNPIALRVRALNEPLEGWQLFIALTHLFKRRGYTEVPWSNRPAEKEDAEAKKELGEIKKKMTRLADEMKQLGCTYPCQLLAHRKDKCLPQRKEVWPRELLEKEFRDILKTQKKSFPKLAAKADWLLCGDTREVKGQPVFFKATEARNPGVLGLRWPRFDNRGPALDALQPLDEQGRPLHVVRKNKEAFIKAQWELAVMNFRVIERATGKLVAPDSHAISRLREM
jgi:hypothetical protein